MQWNWMANEIGHAVFVQNAVYVARVETERGDVLRIWEFDRWNASTWQVRVVRGPRLASANHPALPMCQQLPRCAPLEGGRESGGRQRPGERERERDAETKRQRAALH